MLGSLFFLFALLVLGYVLKYRVHIHLNIEITSSPVNRRVKTGRRADADGRHASGTPSRERGATVAQIATTRPVPIDSVVWGDIQSALESLGAPRHRAKAAAQHVVRMWPDAGFDAQFREALREVQAA